MTLKCHKQNEKNTIDSEDQINQKRTKKARQVSKTSSLVILPIVRKKWLTMTALSFAIMRSLKYLPSTTINLNGERPKV